MNNTKEFVVSVEMQVKVTLDMDKYNKETLNQVVDFWGFNPDLNQDTLIEELVKDIALVQIADGNTEDMEGFPKQGHKSKHIETYINIKSSR